MPTARKPPAKGSRSPRKGKPSNPWSAAGRSPENAENDQPKRTPRKRKAATPEKAEPKTNVVGIETVKPRRRRTGSRGQPTLLTDDAQSKLLAAFQVGSTIQASAAYAGVSERSIYRWLDRGRAEEVRRNQAMIDGGEVTSDPTEELYWQFWQAAETAMASMQIVSLTTIRQLMTDPNVNEATRARLAMHYADRRIPGYAPKRFESLELTGSGGGPVRVELGPDEQLERDRQIIDVAIATGAFAVLEDDDDEGEDDG